MGLQKWERQLSSKELEAGEGLGVASVLRPFGAAIGYNFKNKKYDQETEREGGREGSRERPVPTLFLCLNQSAYTKIYCNSLFWAGFSRFKICLASTDLIRQS